MAECHKLDHNGGLGRWPFSGSGPLQSRPQPLGPVKRVLIAAIITRVLAIFVIAVNELAIVF